ncbi:hypothetical protein BDW62DRAFT_211123 [Aspergillus aurantiobrunneus]
MRSGLRKPGTVPFFALILFSLLSLMPTLAKEWDFYSPHLAYLGLPRHEGRYSSSRVKNASIDSRSRLYMTGSHCKSRFFGDFYSSCLNHNAQPHHSAINTPPRSSFEAGAEPVNDPITYSPTKESSSITRGVSAFKEFVIKCWDDQQMAEPFTPRHDSVGKISTQPTPTLANLSAAPASSNGQQRQPTPASELDATPPAGHSTEDFLLFRLPLFIHETWQQVCHTGGHYLEVLTTRSPTHHYNQTLIPNSPAPTFTGDEQAHSEHLQSEEQPQAESTSNRGLSLNTNSAIQVGTPPGLNDSSTPALSPNPLTMTAGQSKYIGFRRDSEHMDGSSMAIITFLRVIMEDSHFRHSASHHPHPFHSSLYPRDPSLTGTTTALEDQAAQHRNSSYDEEGQPPRYTEENDPFQLASKLKSDAEIQAMHPQANTSRKRHGHGSATNPQTGRSSSALSTVPTLKSLKHSMARKELQGFYQTQNENIERMLKPVEEHRRDARELNTNNQLKYKIAIYGSFAANICLSILQAYGAIASGSLSLFTTMADSIFDPLSNLTLLLCNKTVNRVDPRKFPAGKARIETAGNIGFCFLMTAVSILLIAFSIRDLAAGSDSETGKFHLPSVIAVVVAFSTKFALFAYCFALRNQVSQIRILWEDHRNDLLINGFGILTSVGGSKLRWWIDPMGAIIISVLISCLWLHTAYHEFQLLIGVTADTKMQQLITYISMTHSPLITAIDTVRAYTSGPRLVVEVDIVMDPSDSLRATHDVAEELQTKLESLPDVERAYVHVDYETTHKPEHFLKKEL